MPPPDRHGVVIAGGSLAGMAAAIRLHQLGIPALAIDKSRFPRRKLCGEFLGPDAFPALKRLGVWEAVRALAGSPVTRTHFYSQRGRPLTVEMRWMSAEHPYGLAIPRENLDALLVDHARRLGVAVLEGWRITRLDRLAAEGPFRLRMQGVGGLHTMEAAVVVDAAGRSGGLHSGGGAGYDQVGIQCHIRLGRDLARNDLHMALFEGGYGGIQPLGNGIANLCMLAPAGAAQWLHRDFERLLKETMGRNPAVQAMLHDAEPAGAFSTTANINLDYDPRRTEVIRVGDAMVTVDPYTGSGMAHALETGLMAAECMALGLRQGQGYAAINAAYQQSYRRRYGKRLFLVRGFRPLMHHPGPQAILWPLVKPWLPLLARTLR